MTNAARQNAQFPERYFATCREASGYRFRVYGKTLAECSAKAKKAKAAHFAIYDAVLRMRVK